MSFRPHAIEREKQAPDPTWGDLSENWREKTAGPSAPLRSGRDDKVEGGASMGR